MPDDPSLNGGESNAEFSSIKWGGNHHESSNNYVLNP